MQLRLHGQKAHEKSAPKRHGRQPRTLPVPGLFADSRPGYAGQPECAPHAVVGSSGTGGHPPPGFGAGQCPLLLRRGLQQECVGGLRRTGNDRGSLRLLPLWTGGFHGQPRTTRPPVGYQKQQCRRTHAHNGWNPHYHIFTVNQSPRVAGCRCFDKRTTISNNPYYPEYTGDLPRRN